MSPSPTALGTTSTPAGLHPEPGTGLAPAAARVTAFLQDAVIRDLPTDEVRSELARLQHRLRTDDPDLRLTVVPHVEPFDRSVTYDVVVRTGDNVAVIGVSGGAGLPWPVRAVTRADEHRLLRVNGRHLSVADALTTLDFLFDERESLRTLIRSCLVSEALEEDPIELTDDELQAAADAFRRGKGLLTAERTTQWLTERAMSLDEFENLVRRTAEVSALRRRIAGPEQVRTHFAEHRDRYRSLLVAWVEGLDEELAERPLRSVAMARRAGRAGGVSEWRVSELPEGLMALVPAPVGACTDVVVDDVLGSAVVVDRWDAELDDATAGHIEHELFVAWLDRRRADADVEWHWGDTLRTSGA